MKERTVTRALLCLVAGAVCFAAPGPVRAGDWAGSAVTVRKARIGLWELASRVHREQGAAVAAPTDLYRHTVTVRPGRQTAGALLRGAAGSLGADIEFVTHRGRTVACLWDRPDAADLRALVALAGSKDETDRCTAARWLPVAGSRQAITLAVGLLSDRSRRVRQYAAYFLMEHCGTQFFDSRLSPIELVATRQTARSLVQDLRAPLPKRKYTLLQLAGIVGDPAAVPALIEILDAFYKLDAELRGPNKTRRFVDISKLDYACAALGSIGGAEAERALLAALKKLSGYRTQYPIKGLGLLRTPAACADLLGALKSENVYLSRTAIYALAWRGNGRAVGPLLKVLGDAKTPGNMRAPVCLALVRIGTRESVTAAVKVLRGETDAGRQAGLCMTLCREPAAVETITRVTRSETPRTRQAAVTALGLTGSEQAVPRLVELLEHAEKGTRSRAALSLGRIGGRAATDALITCLADGDLDLKCSAAQALGDAGDPRAAAALRAALTHAEPRLRALAARALGRVGGRDDLPALIAAWKAKWPAGEAYNAGSSALRQLGLIGGPVAAKELAPATKTGNTHAARALLLSRDAGCAAAARSVLKGEDAAAARALLAGLDTFPRRPPPIAAFYAAPALLRELSADAAAARVRAAQIARRLADPRCVDALMDRVVNDADAKVRFNAVLAFAPVSGAGRVLADWRCVEALVEVVKSEKDAGVRRNAIQQIHRLGLQDRPDIAPLLKQ